MPSGPELYIVIAVVLLLFGGSKLPQLARSLGQAKSGFKKGTEESEAAEATTPRSAAASRSRPVPWLIASRRARASAVSISAAAMAC